MAVFKDSDGGEWMLRIDVSALRRCRSLLGIDLNKIAAEEFAPLRSDMVLLCDVIYALCKDQADHRKITDEEFGRRLAGDAILRAVEALIEAYIDFFPDSQARENLRKAESLRKEMASLMNREVAERLASVDLQAELSRLMRLSAGTQESPASSQDHTRSES